MIDAQIKIHVLKSPDACVHEVAVHPMFQKTIKDKEWKERGLGNIKILKNKSSNKCRIVMRREQIHKLCANHAITSEMELKTTQNETNLIWGANDYTEEEMKLEKFLVRFKYAEQAKKFKEVFECARQLANSEELSKVNTMMII